jgi:hypothetical protein
MRFQKNQPAGAVTLVPPSASTGPLKIMDASTPARKAHAHEIHEHRLSGEPPLLYRPLALRPVKLDDQVK